MSTLVERLERIACGFEHESKYGDGLPAQVKQGYLNGAATIREAAAALRATTGEGEWVPKDVWDWLMGANGEFECPDPDYYSGHPPKYWWRRELRRRIAAAPPPPLRDAGAVAWQIRRTDFSTAPWEACTPDAYDDTLRTGRFLGFDNGPPAEARALYAHPAPAQVDEARVLAALGHEPQVSDNCTARVIPTPSDKPGPRDPPIWCHLKAGHDGPHRCNHGGGYRSFPFRKSDPVEFREPVTICAKCRTRWPCPEAEKVSAALAAAAKEGKS